MSEFAVVAVIGSVNFDACGLVLVHLIMQVVVIIIGLLKLNE